MVSQRSPAIQHIPLPIHPALTGYIEEIVIEEDWPQQRKGQPEDALSPYQVLPKPFPVLGFQYRGRLQVVRASATELLALSGVTGLQATSRAFQPEAETRSILVTLKPYAAFALFGYSMSELANAHISLAALVTSAQARAVEEQMLEAGSVEQRSQVVQAFLLRLLEHSPAAPHPLVVEAASRILTTHGRERIASLARDIAISRRQIERLFKQQVGVGPKEFAGLARFDWAVQHATGSDPWSALAYEAGFADQAHFIRSFALRAGAPPGVYFSQSSSR